MSLRQKCVKILPGMLPANAVGVSLLGATVPSAANRHPAAAQSSTSDRDGVALRLTAIREAFSAMADPAGQLERGDSKLQLVWGNLVEQTGSRVGAPPLERVGLVQLEQRAQLGTIGGAIGGLWGEG